MGSIARIERPLLFSSLPLEGWLDGLPLRMSNEGLLRPRVTRAQKIIRLHPLRALTIY